MKQGILKYTAYQRQERYVGDMRFFNSVKSESEWNW